MSGPRIAAVAPRMRGALALGMQRARPAAVARAPLGALGLALPNWSKKNGNRASRTGPFARTKYGMVLVLPFTSPLAITWLWGFGPTLGKIPEAGLVPPGAGCE